MSKRTAVVILNWNTRHLLEKFLPSVIQFSAEVADVIVADNASTDDSVTFLEKKFPAVRIIRHAANEGYTGGYNKALAQIDAEYFMLLNSDVMVTEGWLIPLLKLLDDTKSAGACQPKLLSYQTPDTFEYAGAAGGYIDKYGYPFCRGRIFQHLEKDVHQYDDERKIFWATGACMLVRARVFRELGGFDPLFFAHMEEIDLCWRMKNSGYDVYYCPESSVYHVGGGSLPKSNPNKTYLNFRNNLLLVYKNTTPSASRPVLRMRLLLDAVAALKFLISGGLADFKAVWRARRDFNRMKYRYQQGIPTVVNKSVQEEMLIYPRSILWDYYLCSRKKFSELVWKQAETKG
jgi:GT2 family glycosyltransferase